MSQSKNSAYDQEVFSNFKKRISDYGVQYVKPTLENLTDSLNELSIPTVEAVLKSFDLSSAPVLVPESNTLRILFGSNNFFILDLSSYSEDTLSVIIDIPETYASTSLISDFLIKASDHDISLDFNGVGYDVYANSVSGFRTVSLDKGLSFSILKFGGSGGSGGSVDVVQTEGTSTTDVMSQNAVTRSLSGKQNTLTSGQGISIENNTISCTLSNYNELSNKPSINGVPLSGEKTSDELQLQSKMTFGPEFLYTTENRLSLNYSIVNTLGDSTTDVPSQALLTKALENLSSSKQDAFVVGPGLLLEDGVLSSTGGSSSDYEDLMHKPSINGVIISGSKTSADYKIQSALAFGQGLSYSEGTLSCSISVLQTEGDSLESVMSQKAVTNSLNSLRTSKQDALIFGSGLLLEEDTLSVDMTDVSYMDLKDKPSIDGTPLAGDVSLSSLGLQKNLHIVQHEGYHPSSLLTLADNGDLDFLLHKADEDSFDTSDPESGSADAIITANLFVDYLKTVSDRVVISFQAASFVNGVLTIAPAQIPLVGELEVTSVQKKSATCFENVLVEVQIGFDGSVTLKANEPFEGRVFITGNIDF